MSNFKTAMAPALVAIDAHHGDDCYYYPPNSMTPVTGLKVRVHSAAPIEKFENNVKTIVESAHVYVRESALPNPVKDGRFVIVATNEVWHIQIDPNHNPGGSITCLCNRSTMRRMGTKGGN